jgi:serine-type D-Ala-D-Ala carboxypeptidase (penicillin-binding protein 5/6)
MRHLLSSLGRRLPAIVLLSLLAASPAAAYDTPARAAILVDFHTGQVLFEKNADQPLPPASMSKLMTLLMVFERLEDGSLSLDDTLPVSEKAWRKGGSKMFVEVGHRVRVDDLLHGIAIQSGNDACIVIAEGLAGSEEAFAELMNRRARELGLTNTNLRNASGWPEPDHLMSVRDLARLSAIVIRDYSHYYPLFSQREFEYNGIKQYSRNPLLRQNVGADGLKTGYTEASGYSLVASAQRDGRRLIMVLAGLGTAAARAREAERLLEHGFRNFANYHLVTAGQTIELADVWLGSESRIALVPEESVTLTLSREQRQDLRVKVVYDTPVPAPVVRGAPVGRIEITAPGMEPRKVALVAEQDVAAATLFGRVGSAIGYLLWGAS